MDDIAAAARDLFRAHRSIRRFEERALDRALINEVMLDAMAGSSSSGNLNQVSVVRTWDPERRAQLCRFHLNQAMVRQAPLVLTFCADAHRTRQWLAQRGVRKNFNNLLGYHAAAIDAIILAQTTALLFESRGLGICYVGTTLHWASEIARFLELPEHCLPITSMVVGWPGEQPLPRERLPATAWIHEERYEAPTPASIERDYHSYEKREWARYTAMGEHVVRKMATMGIDSLASYTTSDVGYPPAVFERDSARLRQLLVEKGFLDA